jgi:hypothetical protein
LFDHDLFELGHRQRKLVLSTLLVPLDGSVLGAPDKPVQETSLSVSVCLLRASVTCLATGSQAICRSPIDAVLILWFALATFGAVFETHGNIESLLAGFLFLALEIFEISLSSHFISRNIFF